MIQDMVRDLADLAIIDVERAIETYRKTPFPMGKFKPFPDSGLLRKLAGDERKHREEVQGAPPVKPEFGESRPHFWWGQRRQWWQPHWRESDIPRGELVRDQVTGKLREPQR